MNINALIKELVAMKRQYQAHHVPLHRVHVGFTIERTDGADQFCIFDKEDITPYAYGRGNLDVPGGTCYHVSLMRFTSSLSSEEAEEMEELVEDGGS